MPCSGGVHQFFPCACKTKPHGPAYTKTLPLYSGSLPLGRLYAGSESGPRFNREYKRLFGSPPRQDVNKKRVRV
jgi:hypothetical protein